MASGSPYKSFLGSVAGSLGAGRRLETERDYDDFEVSTEVDFYVPSRRLINDLPDYDVITDDEVEESRANSEQAPLVRVDNREDRGGATIVIGFLLAVLGTLFLTISSGSIQGMKRNYSEFELNVFRFAGSFILAPPVLLFRRMLPRLEGRREILGTAAVTILTVAFNSCLFGSVKYAALGIINCVYRTAVMIFCMVLGWAVMKEKITVPKVLATVIGTAGVVLVTQPWTNPDTDKHPHLKDRWLGYMLSAIAGVVAALKIIVQKKVVPRTDVITLQFWTGVGGLVISALVMAVPSFKQRPVLPEVLSDWWLLLAHAFSTGIATLLVYKSQQMISAILAGLSMTFTVVFSLIGQYTILKHFQPGHRNAEEYSGAALVILSAVLVPVWALVIMNCFSRSRDEEAPTLSPNTGPGINDSSTCAYQSVEDRTVR